MAVQEVGRAIMVERLRPRMQRACAHFSAEEFEALLQRMAAIRLAWEAADAEATAPARS